MNQSFSTTDNYANYRQPRRQSRPAHNPSADFNYASDEQSLHEPIEVDATFSRHALGHAIPRAFRRESGREIQISEVGLIHPRYDGLRTTFAFDVTDGACDYRLIFDSESLNWFLDFEGDRFDEALA